MENWDRGDFLRGWIPGHAELKKLLMTWDDTWIWKGEWSIIKKRYFADSECSGSFYFMKRGQAQKASCWYGVD